MNQKTKQQPVILLVENYAEENSFIKNWLEINNLSIRETADIFDALDEISDFTIRRCPDVFMLAVETSIDKDLAKIKELVKSYSEPDNIVVMTVSGKNKNTSFKQSSNRKFAGTEADLNALLPSLAHAAVSNQI